MSDSVWPHRWQPTRLPHPWDSPGKNTGVGCHSLLQCMKVKSEREVAQLCPTFSDPMDWSLPGSSVHEIFQAKEYWSGPTHDEKVEFLEFKSFFQGHMTGQQWSPDHSDLSPKPLSGWSTAKEVRSNEVTYKVQHGNRPVISWKLDKNLRMWCSYNLVKVCLNKKIRVN